MQKYREGETGNEFVCNDVIYCGGRDTGSDRSRLVVRTS